MSPSGPIGDRQPFLCVFDSGQLDTVVGLMYFEMKKCSDFSHCLAELKDAADLFKVINIRERCLWAIVPKIQNLLNV
ncbi:hypothetical protein H6G45_02770 [Synechocystis sp. FACHB-383]|uniref:hypothetical protein n=1 Tax=Synechocystis sp. FACHB-383 TaxID=2692864 RepID=UPI0019B3D753|nr:hypothetical protein [Synechocystis sp. FACHB-383]MBD2652435.1 hypothetical protein [Synechocystis sp. FACHB-383]